MAPKLFSVCRVMMILVLIFTSGTDARHKKTKASKTTTITSTSSSTSAVTTLSTIATTASQTGLTGTSIATSAPTSWVHPGVFVSGPQLDFIASKVQVSAQPWSEAFTAMLGDPLGASSRLPTPYSTVVCGPTSTPNIGCYDERDDSMAAYMNALAWWITKSTQYANKAILYMDAWSGMLKAHSDSNAPLQSAWSAANWVRAGEIMRYANSSWSPSGITAFGNMLRNVYLPEIIGGSTSNGNWELAMMEASIGIAIFLEDAATYQKAMSVFAARVPAYIYLTSDGPYPIPGRGIGSSPSAIIKYWNGQSTYPVSGITQETCRDFAHTSYGIASISHVAETARIQGNDLWQTSVGTRVKAALELHSPFETGTKIPSWLCGGTIARSMDPVVEPPYNAIAFRLNTPMPNTEKLVLQQRPAGIGESVPLFIGWETLTNAENPF